MARAVGWRGPSPCRLHRALAAAEDVSRDGVQAAVLDLRTVTPLDEQQLVELAQPTGHLVLVDEDHRRGGLSGEVAAVLAEHAPTTRYGRATTDGALPFAPELEARALPTAERITTAATDLLSAEGVARRPLTS